MAKRFTDSEKWKKPFIRTLQAPYKLLWFYILDDCNHAGIWEVDMEVAEIRIGEKLDQLYALECFGDRVQKITENKWFIPDFISFQYGELNEKNRLHLSVIQILNKYQIKPLTSPLEGAKDKDKDKYKDKDMECIVFTIEHCLEIALKDERWVKANKATKDELLIFNEFLEKIAEYEKNPLDYKRHFSNFKHKFPDRLKPLAKVLSIEQLREMAKEMSK